MTLKEKATFMTGDGWWKTYAFPRLGVPSIFMTDGPHGLRKASGSDITASVPATCFPTASCLASSWDPSLLEQVGAALGRECQANDVQLLLGPGNNLKRSPLGGRNFEYFSEDPLLGGKLAAAHIRGVQSEGVGATLKHYVANEQEYERIASSSNIDERTLREIYLRAFEIPVKEAQPDAVMCSYNRLNGVPVSEDPWSLDQVLRKEWGFQGFVVSDWGAVRDRVKGIQAGLNLEMPGSKAYNRDKIIRAVKKGQLKIQQLNEAAAQLLAVVLKLAQSRKPFATFDPVVHHRLARQAAAESLVLLKNEKNLLPLNPAKKMRLAVLGAFAKESRYQGGGSSQVNPTRLDCAYDEISKLAGPQIRLSYAEGYRFDGSTTPALLAESRKVARQSDVSLLFVGLPDSYESEGFDRSNFDIPKDHQKLVEEVAKIQPNLVVVLMNGSSVSMPWLKKPKAVLEAWLGGQAGGGAIADVLFGLVNPCGKLAETFPKRLEDTPAYPEFPGKNLETHYGEGLYVGYRHYDIRKIEPLFPFGYGLSYTTFAYSQIKASYKSSSTPSVHVEVTVKNTGKKAGKEIVQLYVHEQNPETPRPEKELKAFAKVYLQPGESKKVVFDIPEASLGYWDNLIHGRKVNPGVYDILVGPNSRHLPLVKSVRVKGLNNRPLPLNEKSMLKDVIRHPKGNAYYQTLLQATGLAGAIGKGLKKEKMSARERADIEKAARSLMAFLSELPLDRIGGFSEGKFGDDQLRKILKNINGL